MIFGNIPPTPITPATTKMAASKILAPVVVCAPRLEDFQCGTPYLGRIDTPVARRGGAPP
jgi:hypothetical protein